MKALLIKDFLLLKRNWVLFCMTAFALGGAASAFNRDVAAWGTFMVCVVTNALVSETITHDVRCGWNEVQATMPFKKSVPVSEKYVLGLLTTVYSLLVTGAVMLVKALMFIYFDYAFTADEVFLPFCLVGFMLISNGILYPLIYRFNGMRGGSLGFVIGMIASGICGHLLSSSEIFDFCTLMAKIIFVLVIGFLVYSVSWAVSVGIYKKHGVI